MTTIDSESLTYSLRVNGERRDVEDAWLGESLLYVLRERLQLAGAKNACEQGECGSCSVIVDGALVCACLVLSAAAVGTNITTVEAMATTDPFIEPGSTLSSVQQGFVDEGAIQCGFCTPGLVMAVHDLLDRIPDPNDLEIREAISGNLCRCTGYGRIFEAVRTSVSIRMRAVEIAKTSTTIDQPGHNR
jgi:aerobic carbon-monoxide dehydrogenase small subunit